MKGLFQLGDFVLASGQKSDYKIDCDALSKDDLKACAYLLAQKLPPFYDVFGVPSGGLGIARALKLYTNSKGSDLLIVDDVWTTGTSMHRYIEKYHPDKNNIIGAVIFARNAPMDEWVKALFYMIEE